MTDERAELDSVNIPRPDFLAKEFNQHNAEIEHYNLVRELLKSPVANPRQELHIRSRTKHAGAMSVFDSITKTIKRPFVREASWNDCHKLLTTWSIEFEHYSIGQDGQARKEVTEILSSREPLIQQQTLLDRMRQNVI